MTEEALSMSDQAALARRLRARIRAAGPLTFHDWMQAALYDPQAGYYNRADLTRWGRSGDYRTSPERSPLFAATCARYFAELYNALGAPAAWTIIEAGAGAGYFAHGLLQTFEQDYPHILRATRYLIDEQSATTKARARAALTPYTEHIEFCALDELHAPVSAGLIFANELLDALPVHRVIMRAGVLRELCVGLDASEQFNWIEREPGTPRLAAHFERAGVRLAEGQCAEVNLAAEDWLARAATKLARGFVLLVDYGADATELYHAPHRREGTLRAFHGHQLSADVLAQPGAQDVTTTINWTQLKEVAAAAGLQTILFARQDEFLLRAGLLAQLERMCVELPTEAERLAVRLTAREMILPGGMSQSFQVLVLQK